MNNPCEWCNKTSDKIDSLEFQVEELKNVVSSMIKVADKVLFVDLDEITDKARRLLK